MSDTQTIYQVALLDDHPMVGKAIQYQLAKEPDIQIAGLFTQRAELMPFLKDHHLDVLILDYLLGEEDLDGLQMVKQLRQRHPRLNILVCSSVEKPAIVQLLMKVGVMGFVGKSQDFDVLLRAIHQVCSGKRFLTAEMQLELDKFLERDKEMHDYLLLHEEGEDINVLIHQLSPREVEVIRCYLDGLSISQIAGKFSRSRKTISGQKQTALRKLGLRSDVELFKYKDNFKDLLLE